MLNWVFGNKKKRKKKPGVGNKPSYEKARSIAEKGSVKERTTLAAHEDLEPEILYYFTNDESPQVRREIAENLGTPLQADIILSRDPDEEVRCELAMKISRMVPELGPDESDRLSEMALEVLEILANDELPRVRAIISEELKSSSNVPKKIIRNLAEDLEDIVSVPVLEYSPLLSETDLLELVARGMKGRALIAVAQRRSLSERVVDAVVGTDDSEAVKSVLENKTAKITEKTINQIADKAEHNKAWHNAMVYRDDLPVKTVKRIASFVSAALMEALIDRNSRQKALVEELRKTVRKRIENGEFGVDEEGHKPAIDRAEEDHKAGILDEKQIAKALDEDDNAYVRYALSFMSMLPHETVSRMLNTTSSKSITALAWKAGLTMEMAVRLQISLGRIKPDKLLEPAADGGYPLSEADIEWYMESFFA